MVNCLRKKFPGGVTKFLHVFGPLLWQAERLVRSSNTLSELSIRKELVPVFFWGRKIVENKTPKCFTIDGENYDHVT